MTAFHWKFTSVENFLWWIFFCCLYTRKMFFFERERCTLQTTWKTARDETRMCASQHAWDVILVGLGGKVSRHVRSFRYNITTCLTDGRTDGRTLTNKQTRSTALNPGKPGWVDITNVQILFISWHHYYHCCRSNSANHFTARQHAHACTARYCYDKSVCLSVCHTPVLYRK